jgi:hypothetical protein
MLCDLRFSVPPAAQHWLPAHFSHWQCPRCSKIAAIEPITEPVVITADARNPYRRVNT